MLTEKSGLARVFSFEKNNRAMILFYLFKRGALLIGCYCELTENLEGCYNKRGNDE